MPTKKTAKKPAAKKPAPKKEPAKKKPAAKKSSSKAQYPCKKCGAESVEFARTQVISYKECSKCGLRVAWPLVKK